MAVVVAAQAQSSGPQFEVVSVKPNNMPRGPFQNGSCPGGIPEIEPRRFAATTTLYSLISWAYGIDCYRSEVHNLITVGKADWVRKDLFSIDSVIPEGSTVYTLQQLRDAKAAGLQQMIENLLTDRFNLQVHRESRLIPIYALTTGGREYRLKRYEEGSCDPAPPNGQRSTARVDRKPLCGGGGIELAAGGVGRRTVTANGVTLDKFAHLLSLGLDRPVIDQTGITGLFDFRLVYTFIPATGATAPTLDTGGTSSIFSAIQEQLGLKLQSARGPVEVLVIDSVSKPSGN